MTLKLLAAYGKAFPLKGIGALLTDKAFVLNVRDVLKSEYFDSEAHRWIIQQILKYFDDFHATITMEVLKIELQKIDNDVLKLAIREELRHSYEASQEDLEYTKEEFTAFCRNQEMKNAILASTDLLKAEDYEGIRTLIEKALRAGQEKSKGHEYKKDVETRYREDYRPTIPTPWEELNQVFAGGLGPGDLALIFGGPGTGKSWLSIAIAANALLLGYNVNYYTLELGENYVARRFDSYLTGYSVEESKEHRDEVENLMNNLPGNLIIKEYAPKSASISTLEAHIQMCRDDGITPDLIVIDYIDYLKPPGRGYREKKDEIDDNYIGAKGLAKSLNIPVVSPSQVNRSGAKDQVVEGDKAAGSYDKMMVADMSFSLSRKKEDKILGTGRIHIMKNRYGEDGQTYEITLDTNNGHVEFQNKMGIDDVESSSPAVAYNIDRNLMEKFFKK